MEFYGPKWELYLMQNYAVSLAGPLICNQHNKIKTVVTPSKQSNEFLLLKSLQNIKNFILMVYTATHYCYTVYSYVATKVQTHYTIICTCVW